ncbi:hypothetical protein [Ferruginibacter sp.]|nr:hypothetical protein [Ferruginibacter sp.]
MKNLIAVPVLFVSIIILSCLSSCNKPDTSPDKPREQQVVGEWFIERIQLKIYYNNVFAKDTIIARAPKPKNFALFDASNSFAYCFNSYTTDAGTYQFKGTDSLICTTPSKIYHWKTLTLTADIFTVVSTSTNDPAFPGAKVETYQTFAR